MADTPKDPPFVLEAITPVFVTSWVKKTDVCTICRNHVETPCVNCQSNDKTHMSCGICWGRCGHVFHKHCIDKWILVRWTCPMDNGLWEEDVG